MKERTVQEWKDSIFRNECKSSLNNDSGTLRVLGETSETNNTSYFRPTFTNCVAAMFWGCIGSNGVGRLVLCTRTVNAPYYCEILQNNLIQSTESMLGCSETSAYFSVILVTLCGLGNLEFALENLEVWSTFDNFETLNYPLSCLSTIPNTSSL